MIVFPVYKCVADESGVYVEWKVWKDNIVLGIIRSGRHRARYTFHPTVSNSGLNGIDLEVIKSYIGAIELWVKR